ncbi:hypothetical protein QOT81_10995, partial [Pseudomonas aeruginosa]
DHLASLKVALGGMPGKYMATSDHPKETCTPELLRNVEKAIARGKTGNKLTLRTVDRKSLEQ